MACRLEKACFSRAASGLPTITGYNIATPKHAPCSSTCSRCATMSACSQRNTIRRRNGSSAISRRHSPILRSSERRRACTIPVPHSNAGREQGPRHEMILTPTTIRLTSTAADLSPSPTSLHDLDGVYFFLAGVLAGFGPYVAVYLADQKWTQDRIGFVLSASALAGLLSQVPGGELLDTIRAKRAIVALGVLVVALSAIIIEFRRDFSLVLIALMLQGVTGGTGPPAGEDKQRLRLRPRSRELGGACKPPPLLGSIAQNIFQGDVEIA